MRVRGFTLIEILVALSIFTMLGLGSHQLLTSVIRTRDATEIRTRDLVNVQRALNLLEHDLLQVTDRAVRDEYGETMPALMAATGDYLLEFSRLGWRNPRSSNRSTVQRVAWTLNDETLERHYWLQLDRAEDSKPRVQKILEGVTGFRVNLLDADEETLDVWGEPDAGLDDAATGLPASIEVLIQTATLGELRKVVNLVQSVVLGGGEQVGEGAPGEGAGQDGEDEAGQSSEQDSAGNPEADDEVDPSDQRRRNRR